MFFRRRILGFWRNGGENSQNHKMRLIFALYHLPRDLF